MAAGEDKRLAQGPGESRSSKPDAGDPTRGGRPKPTPASEDLVETLAKADGPRAEAAAESDTKSASAVAAPAASGSQSESPAGSPAEDEVPVVWEPGMTILDTYEVKAKLGEGGFGTVYKVHHKGWNTDMAVKSALFHVSREDITREAEVWMELGLHPNIVSCYFVRTLGGIPRIFVEYVEGGTLDEWLCGKKKEDEDGNETVVKPPRDLTRAQRLGIAIEICRGMQRAHGFEWTDRDGHKQVGIVHRDLKPQNILMTADGMARVTDFGLVGFGPTSGDGLASSTVPVSAADVPMVKSIRQEGGLQGTPAYAAPEQWTGGRGPITQAADIYAFGVILYEIFCGRRPFVLPEEYRHAAALLQLAEYERIHCEQEPPAPASLVPDIDPELSALILQCLAKTPEDRPSGFARINERLKAIHERLEGDNYDDLRPEPEAAELLADSLNNRALSYLEIGQPKRAEELWEEALKVDPHHPEATYNRGLLRWRTGRMTDEALVRELEEMRTSHPHEWIDEYLLGLIHIERGDAEAAVKVLEAASEQSGGDRSVQTSLRLARGGVGRWRRCFRTFDGHTNGVTSVCFSPDGRWALSGSLDNTVRLWDVASGRCLRTFEGSYSVTSVCFSPDGRRALSASFDETLRLWDVSSGRCLQTFEGHTSLVYQACFSPDGRWALSGSRDKTLRLWDVSSGRCLRTFEGHKYGVSSVCFSPDGRWALSAGGSDNTLRLWDVAGGRCLRTFMATGHREFNSACFSPDGRWALSGSIDCTLRLWDVSSGRCLRTFKGHTKSVCSVCFSPDGRWALSGSIDCTLRLWDVSSGRCLRTFDRHWHSHFDSVCFSPDGRWALSVSIDCTLRLWDVAGEACPAPFVPTRPASASDALSAQRSVRHHLSAARGFWEASDNAGTLASLRAARKVLGFQRDPRILALWNTLATRSRRTGLLGAWHARLLEGHTERVSSVCFSPDGQWALSGSGDQTLRLWEVSSGRCLRTFEEHPGPVYSVCFSPDGRWALSCGHDQTLRLWNVSGGHCLRTLRGHTKGIMSVCFGPDGRWILSTGGGDKTLRLWDVSDGRCLRTFKGHTSRVTSVCFSPDSRWALSGSHDKSLRLWDVSSGRCLRTFEEHTDSVRSVCLSPDGQWSLSGSSDKTLRLWEVADGRCLRTFEGHTNWVASVCFSPDGRWALSGSGDQKLRLWDVSSGRCPRTFEGHTSAVTSVRFSPDGRWVLSGSLDKTLRLSELDWDLEAPEAADWDEGARSYLETFLTLHCPLGAEDIVRVGQPRWNEQDFKKLLTELGFRGYGWLRPKGVRRELEKMTREWQGPPPLPGEAPSVADGLRPAAHTRPQTRERISIDSRKRSSPSEAPRPGVPTATAAGPADLEKTLIKPPKARAKTPPDWQGTTCQHCGKTVSGDVRFCLHCGKPPSSRPSPRATPQPGTRGLVACSCGFRNPPGNAFCNQCGKRLPATARPMCRHCSKIVPPGAAFCVHCGKKVGGCGPS